MLAAPYHLAGDVGEVGVDVVLGRHVEFRKRLLDFFQLDFTALGDFPGAIDGVLELTEQLHHFVARFDVEIRMVPVHAGRIAHGLASLDAHQDFVRAGVVAAQIVRIVGGDQGDAGFLRELVYDGD